MQSQEETFICKFEHFREIARADNNSTKWVASIPFSLCQYPDVQFCLMFLPTGENGGSGLYLQPLSLGPYKSMKTRMRICVEPNSNNSRSKRIANATHTTFYHQSLEGQGWLSFFPSSSILDSLLTADTLIVKCTIDVLETTTKTTAHQDRFTSFDWQLDSFKSEMDTLEPQQVFEFESPTFSLERQPDLKLQMIFKKNYESQFAEVHLLPAEMTPANVRLNYLIWIEDQRTGLRLPTWIKETDFDFEYPRGRFDLQFVPIDRLCCPNSPFLKHDGSLQIHCRIYHDSSNVHYVQELQLPEPGKQSSDYIDLNNQKIVTPQMNFCTIENTNLSNSTVNNKKELEADDCCFKVEPIPEDDEPLMHSLPHFDDFQFAELMSKRMNDNRSKSVPHGIQELVDVLIEMRKIQEEKAAKKQAISDKIWKMWSNDETDAITFDSFPEMSFDIPVSLDNAKPVESGKRVSSNLAKNAGRKSANRVCGEFATSSITINNLKSATPKEMHIPERYTFNSISCFVESAGSNEIKACEFRCRGHVYKTNLIHIVCKSSAIDRALSSVVLGDGRKLIFNMDKYSRSSVQQFVEYLQFSTNEYPFFAAQDLAIIAGDFEMPELKENCISQLIKFLNVKSVCRLLTFAIQQDLVQLVDKAIGFAAQHYNKICWRQLCPDDAETSDELRSLIEEVHRSFE